jgi:porphyrinogen peroxidase
MSLPQSGIFALGDTAHLFMEFQKRPGISDEALVRGAANLHPRTTVGSVNLVTGFRPALWGAVAPNDTPADARDFDTPIVGPDGFTMPATQTDMWLWIAGASRGVLWDAGHDALKTLRRIAVLDRHVNGWTYRHSRDLTGFEDGTENPSLLEASQVALVPAGQPGEGGSIVLFQQWRHEESWLELRQTEQEHAMGRTKRDSVEFEGDRVSQDSHVSRAKDVVNGEERDIFRRNVPYGDIVDYGTLFVGFSCDRSRLQRMLERMSGAEDGIRDALTRYTTPLTGAYYVVPSMSALTRFARKAS